MKRLSYRKLILVAFAVIFMAAAMLPLGLDNLGDSRSDQAAQDQSQAGEKEKMLIKEAVEQLYIKGLEIRNFALIQAICIPEALLMSANRSGSLNKTTLEKWKARFDPENPPFQKLESRITKIDCEGTAAQVKIRFIVDSKRNVTDFLHMLKLEGKWRIVNIIDY